MPPSRSEIVELLAERPSAVAYDISQPLANFLREARDLADGDLDKAFVMVVIISRANQHPEFKKLSPERLRPDSDLILPTLGTNVRSLAESTGIPKETVRRKVLELIDAGWVTRDGRTLRYTLEGFHAVAPAREALYRMYAQAFQVVGALLDSKSPVA